jgi:biofilm PGA synthesis N-glycosyltransferase PgaC
LEVVFWTAVAVLAYTYVGYLGVLRLRCLFRILPISAGELLPDVSIVMAMRNEAKNVGAKLATISALDYPSDQIQIVVASDGSTDGTNEILRAHRGVRAVILNEHGGKALALNAALQEATSEVVVFTDARQALEPGSLRNLVSNFADPTVGCVSGELMLRDEKNGNVQSLGLYWKIEKLIRQLESRSGSVVGATGSLYAVRRELIPKLPTSLLLDDVYVPMHVARSGYRVIFEPRSKAWDVPVAAAAVEFRRKVRTLMGNYQLLQLSPWLLGAGNPLWFEFVSHKLLRLAAPLFLLFMLLLPLLLHGSFYTAVFILQVLFYAVGLMSLAGVRLGPLHRFADISSSFILLNSAAAMAFVNTVIGRRAMWA